MVISLRRLLKRTAFVVLLLMGSYGIHGLTADVAHWLQTVRSGNGEVTPVLADPVVQEGSGSRLSRLLLFYELGE
ncbi:hypothetical protein [Gorillibacterium sp. CAU 1737]|uniref:hypothetical protein n=1 Tax=Gorillibacterium sp. CAU 1737 TaxID=3140362 RepID=UPI00325FF9FC